MYPDEYRVMREMEDTFWLYRGMRTITATVIERMAAPSPQGLCLDAGCGTGANLEFLSRWCECLGLEINPHAMPFLAGRGITRVVMASADRVPFPDNTFDLVTAFEVIQCIENDVAALRELRRTLKPGGRLIVREAAFNILYGEHDRAVCNFRRYTRRVLIDKMREAGLKVVWTSYANFFLFGPILALRTLRRVFRERKGADPRSDFRFTPGALNPVLYELIRLEAAWLTRFRFPFGVSVIAVGEKGDAA